MIATPRRREGLNRERRAICDSLICAHPGRGCLHRIPAQGVSGCLACGADELGTDDDGPLRRFFSPSESGPYPRSRYDRLSALEGWLSRRRPGTHATIDVMTGRRARPGSQILLPGRICSAHVRPLLANLPRRSVHVDRGTRRPGAARLLCRQGQI